jgi:hypothetical protein
MGQFGGGTRGTSVNICVYLWQIPGHSIDASLKRNREFMASANQVETIKAVPATGISMAFTAALTLKEYIKANEFYGKMIDIRCDEIRIPPEIQSYLATYPDMLYVMVVAASEDPDTVAVVPILATIVNSSARLSMRLLRDEDDLTLLDGLLENVDLLTDLDDLDLPQAFFFDEEWQLMGQWGPRPKDTEAYLDGWLEENPEYEGLAESDDDAGQEAYAILLDRLTYEMRVWYNSGLNGSCIREVHDLLVNLQNDGDATEETVNGETVSGETVNQPSR